MIFLSLRFYVKSNLGFFKCKIAIFTHLEVLNFYFYEFFHVLQTEIYQINKVQSPKMVKAEVLELLDFPKFISREI